jgi:shikimate kinase
MRLSLIGMAGTGKSYWATKLSEHGFKLFCCDDLISKKLAPLLKRPDGATMRMGEWMGFPFHAGYKKRESKYLNFEIDVLNEILDCLEGHDNTLDEDVVVDTTGSVIYTGKGILKRLRQYTTVVHLSIPPEVREQLLTAYVSNPHPMLWRDIFSKEPNETHEAALERCYPKLFSARQRLYECNADVEIDYYTRREEGFGVSDFLHLATSKSQSKGGMKMTNEKKVVKGGFRATLALLISIIALVLAIVSFNRTVTQSDLNAEVRNLQEKLKEVKQETTARVNKIREETGKAMEKIGKALKKEE